MSGEIIDDSTEPTVTVPETTIAPTTVDSTTVEASSTAVSATADSASKQATADTADNNAVQTGNTGLVSAVVLIVGLAFAAVMYYKRKINL